MREPRRIQHPILTGFIQIIEDQHALPAFWGYPSISGIFPGLVLIHEMWGLTAHMRMQVRRLAELGFYVVAPDLFDGIIAKTPEESAQLRQRLGETGPARIGATLRALETHNHCTGKVAVIGWQMGGELAFHAAMHRTDLSAAIAFYAKPDEFMTMMAADETPILAFYGDSDPEIPVETVTRLRDLLDKAPGEGKVVVYPGTSSGFFNETNPAYNEQAASDAWFKMIDFLTDHMDVPLLENNQNG
jgi:carboxymethylenebutenolidase